MVACLALVACRRDHPPPGAVEVRGADCAACHKGADHGIYEDD